MHSTPPISIEPPDDKAVIELISHVRLDPYLTASAGDSTAALALYRWNSDLAAAFFDPLGHLEIMLRNALDARLVARQQHKGRHRRVVHRHAGGLDPESWTRVMRLVPAWLV